MVSNHSSHSSFWEPQCLLLLEIRPLVLRCLTLRKWVWNCFALKGNYSDLPSWRWLSQSNTLALTVESEFFLEGFAGDFMGFSSLQVMTLLFHPSHVCFVFVLAIAALVKSWLLSVSKWNAVLAASLLIKMSNKRRVNAFIVFSQQPVDAQVPALAHPWVAPVHAVCRHPAFLLMFCPCWCSKTHFQRPQMSSAHFVLVTLVRTNTEGRHPAVEVCGFYNRCCII